jgi:PFK_mixed: phosphofructokinase
MKKRVGILTSGGDCPGLNATIRGVAKALYARFGENVEIVGILNGYHGLITGDYKEMTEDDFRGILTLGGTILGTKRTPFKLMRVVEEDKIDKVAAMKKTYKDAKLDCLLCLGGNGTHKTANLLAQEGLNIIGLPKTIDNDIYGTDVTFGFHTAVDIATEVIDRIHTTAGSHSRVMCIEIMGNKAGWLTLYSGIAGGADIILLPEQPYDIDRVCSAVERRARKGSNFSIIAVAEGCHQHRRGRYEAEGVDGQAHGGRLRCHRHQPHRRRRPEKDRHGDPRLHPGPYAARRQPQRL